MSELSVNALGSTCSMGAAPIETLAVEMTMSMCVMPAAETVAMPAWGEMRSVFSMPAMKRREASPTEKRCSSEAWDDVELRIVPMTVWLG